MGDFNKGEVFIVEVELKKYTPFGEYTLADPDSLPQIQISDRFNKTNVSEDMVKSTTGKYFYLCATESTWKEGKYKIIILSIYDSKKNVFVKKNAFELE